MTITHKHSEPGTGPMPDWTAADYDSYEVLASIGVHSPASRVTQARASRIVHPAAARAGRTHSGLRGVAAVAHHGADH